MNAISEITEIPTRTLIAEIRRRHTKGTYDAPEGGAEKKGSRTEETIVSISQMVAGIFGVSTEGLLGASRQGPLAEARFAAWLILRDCGYMPCEIAPVYRRLDTGTVRHGCHRGRALIQADRRFARKLKQALDLVAQANTPPDAEENAGR